MRALTELKKECFSRVSEDKRCLCGNSKPKQLLIHHLSYTLKSVTYNKFENSDDGRLKYYVNLLDEIKEDPKNFLILCFNCHKRLEELLKLSYEQVLKFMQNNDVYFLLLAYNLTCEKRGMKTIENPEDETFPPIFIEEVTRDWELLENMPKNELKVHVSKQMEILYSMIQTNKLSMLQFSQSAILGNELSYYIKPYPLHVIAAKQLQAMGMKIDKSFKISYVRILNEPFVKPIELLNKNEINVKYYNEWLKARFLRYFENIFDIDDYNKMIGKTGLDEFFWS